MNLKGDEQKQPILKSLRKRGLNIPHLDDAYEIWNADENGQLIFEGNPQREEFGYSLYATNFKIQSSSLFLKTVKELFDPRELRSEKQKTEDYRTDHLLRRYTYLGALLWSIFGALDSLAWGIVIIQKLEKDEKKITPKECTFEKIKNILHSIQQGNHEQRSHVRKKSTHLVEVFKKEQMFSGKNWYYEARNHRHLHTHAKHLFDVATSNQNGEFLPKYPDKDPKENINPIRDAGNERDLLLANKKKKELYMTKPIHIWTEDLFNNCNRFIGDIFLALRKTYEPEIRRLCIQTN